MKIGILKSVIYAIIIFLAGGIVFAKFSSSIFGSTGKNVPAIYYHKIEVVDEVGQPITGVAFSWSNRISMVFKKTAPYVVDEIISGVYIIGIAGRYQSSSLNIDIIKDGFIRASIRCDALQYNGNFVFEDNYGDNYNVSNYKLVLRRVPR